MNRSLEEYYRQISDKRVEDFNEYFDAPVKSKENMDWARELLNQIVSGLYGELKERKVEIHAYSNCLRFTFNSSPMLEKDVTAFIMSLNEWQIIPSLIATEMELRAGVSYSTYGPVRVRAFALVKGTTGEILGNRLLSLYERLEKTTMMFENRPSSIFISYPDSYSVYPQVDMIIEAVKSLQCRLNNLDISLTVHIGNSQTEKVNLITT